MSEEADDRLEAAEQRVTALLQQVDKNINRATDSAANLITDAREFALNAKKAQASIEVWVEFFRSFEECERRKFFAGQHEGDPNTTASKLDLTADSLPSFFISPRTPCLDDSMRAGFKRRYGSPGLVGDTPSFGCSPPKSVKMRHAHEASVDDSIAQRLSPVGQPVFPRASDEQDSSFKLDDSVVDGGDAECNTWAVAAGGDESMESMPTPKMSSPTRTVQVEEADFESWKEQQQPEAAPSAASLSTPLASGTRRSTRNGGPAETLTSSMEQALVTPNPAADATTPKSAAGGGKTATTRRGTPKASAGRRGTPRRGRHEEGERKVEEEAEVGEEVSKLPPLVLRTLPPLFRVGEGSKQIRKVYGLFGCRPGVSGDDYPTLEFGDVVRSCRGFETDRIRFLLDSLVAKRVLATFESEAGSMMWQFSGKEN